MATGAVDDKNITNEMLQFIFVGDKLIHVQVSENHRGVPGTGLTPWNDFKLGLSDINYSGGLVIESFTPEIKELAAAVCIWKTMAKSQDDAPGKVCNWCCRLILFAFRFSNPKFSEKNR